MAGNIKRMAISEFRESGFLQEANRVFFHPLGLALEITQDEDGSERLGGIWDYRDDPEGMAFGPEVLQTDEAVKKQWMVADQRERLRESRQRLLGFDIQPVGRR